LKGKIFIQLCTPAIDVLSIVSDADHWNHLNLISNSYLMPKSKVIVGLYVMKYKPHSHLQLVFEAFFQYNTIIN
jgi:hypothetical protein